MRKKYLIVGLICLFCMANSLPAMELGASRDPFPLYPSLTANVAFWKKVFTQYSTAQGVVHDCNDLNIIYEVIDLHESDSLSATEINRDRIKAAKAKYQNILMQLAKSPFPSTPEAMRVAGLFGPNPTSAIFRKAKFNIRCQIGQKDSFKEGLIRSGAYLDRIKDIFRLQGLPPDLAYLPHVESAFKPQARSKYGAAGIWQFTRSTGRLFMTIDYSVDERWDPICSTIAAARLLKQNYDKLGSWPLAITAYNHGAAGMSRAKASNGNYEAIFNNYKSRTFKFASRNFYSEYLAVREVAKDHERYFGALELDRPIQWAELVLDGYASIRDLSHYGRVDMGTLRSLNPALQPSIFNGQKYVPGGYVLRLPVRAGLNIAHASPQLWAQIYRSHQKPSPFYRVQEGDTVAKIARMHGLETSELISANRLNSSAVIYVNQNLRLPVPHETPQSISAAIEPAQQPLSVSYVADANRNQDAPDDKRSLEHATAPVPSRTPSSQSALNMADHLRVGGHLQFQDKTVGIIRVEAGETLGHYAEWLDVPIRSIRQLNGLRSGEVVKLHQEVKLPLDRVAKEQFEALRYEYHQKIEEEFFNAFKVATVQIYRVKKGESIWTLCDQIFKMPLWLVKKYNPQVNFNDLRWSQKLKIPVIEKLPEERADSVAI